MDVEKVVNENTEVLSRMLDVLQGYLKAIVQHLPRIIIGVLVFAAAIFIAKSVKTLVVKISSNFTHDPSLLSLFGSMGYILTVCIGVLVASASMIPGLQAGDLVAVLGLSSVAGGFAFKDIIENFLAGILILIRRPFTIRDEIEVAGVSGVVEDITFRTTMIRTFDGQRVVVPNATVFKSSIVVSTNAQIRRSSFSAGIAYSEDVNTARAVILEALKSCEAVLEEPAPVALCWEHDSSSINFEVRYWTNSQQKYVVAAHDQVATAIKYALDKAEIEIPFPYLTLDYPLAEVIENVGNRYLSERHGTSVRPMSKKKLKAKSKGAPPTTPDDAEPVSATNLSDGEEEKARQDESEEVIHHAENDERKMKIDVLKHTFSFDEANDDFENAEEDEESKEVTPLVQVRKSEIKDKAVKKVLDKKRKLAEQENKEDEDDDE